MNAPPTTTESFSNSLIEAWSRFLKHQWLFLNHLDSLATRRKLIESYVTEHNQTMPHSTFRGQMPDEMYFARGKTVPVDDVAGLTTTAHCSNRDAGVNAPRCNPRHKN